MRRALGARYSTTYAYDALGQLTRVNDEREQATWTYDYDLGGNMLEKKRYAYTTEAALSEPTLAQTIPYTYDDTGWKDKLTAYDGKAITYEAIIDNVITYYDIGNPLTYDGWTYTWLAGRMLSSMVRGTVNVQFTYDHTRLRVKKSVNGVDTLYTLNGKKIAHIRKGTSGANGTDTIQMHFFYDAQGRPAIVRYNSTDYAYLHNLQGDIVSILDMEGNPVVQYGYDAWGKPVSTEGSMAGTLGQDNPFRYRGYVWDAETGLYYLRSRYYDPNWGRFVNADVQLSERNARLFEHNVYSYCRQNPVVFTDSDGLSPVAEAQQFFVNASMADGPYPVGDAIGFFGALLILAVGAFQIAYAPTIPATAIPRSEEKVKSKTQTLDMAPSLPNQENDLKINRYGGASPNNLVPSRRDVDEGGGLSFSTIPRDGATMTTIGAVNKNWNSGGSPR